MRGGSRLDFHYVALGLKAVLFSWRTGMTVTHCISIKLQTSECVWLTAVTLDTEVLQCFTLCEPHDHPWGTHVYTVIRENKPGAGAM